MYPYNKIYTLEDLKNWDYPSTSLAVIGHPVAHSLSPIIHNAALEEMAHYNEKFTNWRYFKFDISPDKLEEALDWMYKKHFQGINLTMPHKSLALDFVNELDDTVKIIGATNTLVKTAKGYKAYNTDAPGLEVAIEKTLNADFKGTPVILLGAGGAARAAAVQALISGCSELWVGNRNSQRLEKFIEEMKAFSSIPIYGFNLFEIPKGLPNKGIIVNATSLGMYSKDPIPVDLSNFSTEVKVYDMVYGAARTPLVKEARKLGLKSANGLSMLIHQGVVALEYWAGEGVPVTSMLQALSLSRLNLNIDY